ncbi:hypothetical protein [Herbaspirillum sp. SJZ107]|nr:hypothetical protein [Herbaspirillum sp. SJZ107]
MRRILRPIEGFSTAGGLIDAVSRFGKTVKLKADRYYSDICRATP